MAFADGEPVASISVVNYGPGFGFLGFYICRPDRRGRGIGYRLWQAGMARHGDRVVGLDGVVEQQDNYRKSGFELAYRNIRHSGRRSEEHTSALQSLMRTSYAVFCLKKKTEHTEEN